jgi:hypothetical protein
MISKSNRLAVHNLNSAAQFKQLLLPTVPFTAPYHDDEFFKLFCTEHSPESPDNRNSSEYCPTCIVISQKCWSIRRKTKTVRERIAEVQRIIRRGEGAAIQKVRETSWTHGKWQPSAWSSLVPHNSDQLRTRFLLANLIRCLLFHEHLPLAVLIQLGEISQI